MSREGHVDALTRALGSRPTWTVTPMPEITYCKECRHWKGDAAYCKLSGLSVGPNDFCSKGDIESHD